MAKTVYVRKTGNDANSGLTELLAKLTINGANAIAVATDTIDIGQGTFTETNELGKTNGVTYKGAGMFLTIISGDIPRKQHTTAVVITDLRVNWTTVTATDSFATNINMYRTYHDFTSYSPSGTYSWLEGLFKLYNNIFYNYQSTDGTSHGLIGINRSSIGAIVEVIGNTFINCGKTGSYARLWIWSNVLAGTSKVKNNIFYNCTFTSNVSNILSDYSSVITTHSNNCFYSGTDISAVYDASDFTADPLLRDPSGGDGRLLPGSPCIGAGTAII